MWIKESGCCSVARHRSTLEIYLDVLRVIKNGTHKPILIMRRANLSGKPFSPILRSLISQGLIVEFDVRDKKNKRTYKSYQITPKGKNVIKYYNSRASELDIISCARMRNDLIDV